MFTIYLKSVIETGLVYNTDISIAKYQWDSFFISFIEFINIGLIISSISKLRDVGDKNWEKNEEFVAVVERIQEESKKIRKLKFTIMSLKIKTKTLPIKYKILTIFYYFIYKIKKRKIAKQNKEIVKKQRRIVMQDKEIAKLKNESEEYQRLIKEKLKDRK